MEVSALTHSSSVPGLHGPSPLLRLQSDERLIALTRRGQHAAFETLCARYQSRLLSFCRHMLASREDAEDVLQEVFAAAFNAVLADDREINVRPWLYRIARNRSLNHLRRASAIGVDSMDVHFADHGLSTGERVMRRESFRELIGDVHELPETQRTALLLREIDALSYDQIAHTMETTVPSVKSLLVRARISLAEAAEARKLSCDQVRLELGEVAEGLTKLSTPARRHVRGCERCTFFKKQLKENNHALAAILPVGPLLILKKLLLTKLGSTASAGGAHVAGAGGATVGAGAAGTVGAGAIAGVGATGGASVAGGLLTAGAGAIATKAVAGLAAAAIVTAGAVAADHAVVHHHPAASAKYAAAQPVHYPTTEPVVVREQPQPLSQGTVAVHKLTTVAALAAHRAAHLKATKKAMIAPAGPAPVLPSVASSTAAPVALPPTSTPSAKPATPPPSGTQVTEVTTESTQLPASATSGAPAQPSTTTTTTPTSTAPAPPTPAPVPTPTPTPPASEATYPAIETSTTTGSEASGYTTPSAPHGANSGAGGGTEAPAGHHASIDRVRRPSAELAEGEAPQRPLQNTRRADFRRRRGL
jgi:RNA polymerase sigma factor (sigma-70 family)